VRIIFGPRLLPTTQWSAVGERSDAPNLTLPRPGHCRLSLGVTYPLPTGKVGMALDQAITNRVAGVSPHDPMDHLTWSASVELA